MTRTTTTGGDVFARVLDPANRPDPYPLYARLRETPVALQDDGTYVVSTHAQISTLLHDPRVSSDERKSARGAGALVASGKLGAMAEPPFIFLDPPDHDRLRRLVMGQFTPARVEGMRDRAVRLVDELLDARGDRGQLDVVDDLAYPLPVAVICDLLGVPREDEPRFHGWATALARSLDPAQGMTDEEARQASQAATQMGEYMARLVMYSPICLAASAACLASSSVMPWAGSRLRASAVAQPWKRASSSRGTPRRSQITATGSG